MAARKVSGAMQTHSAPSTARNRNSSRVATPDHTALQDQSLDNATQQGDSAKTTAQDTSATARPRNTPVDRSGLRAAAEEQAQAALAALSGASEEEQLVEISRLTNEAGERAKVATARMMAAALSSEFYDGTRGNLAPLIGVNMWAWSDRRRRALQLQDETPLWLRTASREEIVARAREHGVPRVLDDEARLAELGVEAVSAQESKAALTEIRNRLIRQMYTVSNLNPEGRTQPQLAKLAGITTQLVWQIINPREERKARAAGR